MLRINDDWPPRREWTQAFCDRRRGRLRCEKRTSLRRTSRSQFRRMDVVKDVKPSGVSRIDAVRRELLCSSPTQSGTKLTRKGSRSPRARVRRRPLASETSQIRVEAFCRPPDSAPPLPYRCSLSDRPQSDSSKSKSKSCSRSSNGSKHPVAKAIRATIPIQSEREASTAETCWFC